MALCASGEMSLGGSTVGRSVNCELGCAGTAEINMGRADVRDLADRPSGCIQMSDFYGKSSFPTPTAFGQCEAAWGGIYMGTISAASSCYYLFVAPNATGCSALRWWKQSTTCTGGACSCVDGFANTYGSLDNDDHRAGNFCATRTIGGFSDWYLPAVNEMQIIYDNGGNSGNESVIGPGEAFQTARGAATNWTSTEINACCVFRANVTSGGCFCSIKFSGARTTTRTRAVRREPI